MTFQLLDISKWHSREHFEHYLHQIPCSYSMTLNLDLTLLLQQLKKQNIKLYPSMIYLISSIVNQYEEFKTAIDANGHVGIFDCLHPSYTIFQKDKRSFTNIWTSYIPSFSEFYKHYLLDIEKYSDITRFVAKPDVPSNVFHISSIPWVSFTGFNLNLPKSTDYLLPIFTMGKYFEQSGKIWLPIAIQVHHAVCDAFHVGRFLGDLQEAMNTLIPS